MKLALFIVTLTHRIIAVGSVAVAGSPILTIDITWALRTVSQAKFGNVTLPTGGPAGGAIRSELAVGLAAGACSTLGSSSQLAGQGVTAGVSEQTLLEKGCVYIIVVSTPKGTSIL